jgi:hypothetical protein
VRGCNHVKTPFASGIKLYKRTENKEAADGELYRRMIGKLMNLTIYARPDFAYPISKLSQFNSNPSIEHLRAAKYVL